MTDTDDPQHRAYHQPDPDDVEVRDLDGNDGTFAVRMPIASTGEVRNEGDEPLTRDEIEGMAQQIEQRSIGVFLDHGSNMDVSGSRYSAVGKVGEWEASEVTERSGTDVVEAEARLMDPETLPAAAGSVREALAAVKSQVERDIALSSSIGWRDDDAMAGGVDLLEASIVGIPADPRTTTQGAAVELARAAQAARDDADPEQLVAEFRTAVMGPDEPRHLSTQQAEIATTLLNAYRDEQGDGSVENFEEWLWSVAYHQFEDNEFHAAQTALREFYRETTPLEEPVSQQFGPFLDNRQGDGGNDSDDDDRDMSDDDSQSGDDPDDTNDGQDGMDAKEYRESMLELQKTQTEILRDMREGDDDDDDEDDEDEQSADTDDQDAGDRPTESQTLDVDGEEYDAEDVRELRERLADADVETPDDEDDADEADADATDSTRTTDDELLRP